MDENTTIATLKNLTNKIVNGSADLDRLQKVKSYLDENADLKIDKDGVEWFPDLVPAAILDQLS